MLTGILLKTHYKGAAFIRWGKTLTRFGHRMLVHTLLGRLGEQPGRSITAVGAQWRRQILCC